MAIKYVGNVQWEETEELQWSVDNWGVDQAVSVFRGALSLKKQFEDSLQRFTPLPGFPGMQLARWNNVAYVPVFPGVALVYIGFRNGSIPPVKKTNDLVVQSAQGQGTDTATGDEVSGTFLYRAARTSYQWFETKKPALQSRYNTVDDTTDPRTRVINYSIQKVSDGSNLNNVPYSSFVAIFNSLVPRVIVSTYSTEELIPGALWGCRADVDYKLQN